MLCTAGAGPLALLFVGTLAVSGEGASGKLERGQQASSDTLISESVDILTVLPLTGPWGGGKTMMLSARIAEDLINEEQAILPGLVLTNHFFDDRCSSQTSQEILLREATSDDAYVAFGGAGCDSVCGSVSFVADAIRLPFVSYECAGDELSSTIDYPALTRMGTMTTSSVGTVIGALTDLYGWQNVAIITGDPAVYGTKALALETDMNAFQLTTETYSVYEDSSSLLEDIKAVFEILRDKKWRIVYILADESLYRKIICGSIIAHANMGLTWLSDGTWRHRWWTRTDAIVSDNMQWLSTDAATDTLRLFFTDIKQAWDAYGGTTDARREGLQMSYVTDQKEFLDFAEGDEQYHSVHKVYHPTYRSVLYERNYYDIFLFDLNGDLIYSVFKELDFATNFRHGGGGEWSESGLADAFESALANPHTLHETPWSPYGPSNGELASFIATGIFGESGDIVGVFAIQLHPSARSIELIEPECSLEAIEEHFEGAVNIAGLGRPMEQDMDKPLPCFQNHTARTFNALIQKHLVEGYPSGDVGSVVEDPINYVSGNGADATCVFAYTVKHLLGEGYTLSQIRQPSDEVYNKFQAYIKEQVDFDGVSGRVAFSGNDKPNTIGIDQVRKLSAENPIIVGQLLQDGTLDLTAEGGLTNESWQPADPDPPPPPPPPDNFPYLVFQILIPMTMVCVPVISGCVASFDRLPNPFKSRQVAVPSRQAAVPQIL
jgi:hypothetical protein